MERNEQVQERWSDYDSSSSEDENAAAQPEETIEIRELREQARARRKRRAGEDREGGDLGERPRKQQRRRKRVPGSEVPPSAQPRAEEPPPPMDGGGESPGEPTEDPAQEDGEQHQQQQLIDPYAGYYEEGEHAQGDYPRDTAWMAEKQAEEDKETRDAHYKPALLPLEKEIEQALRLPGENIEDAGNYDTCVLCNSQQLSGVGLVRDNFNMMLRALMDQITQIAPQVLFRQLYEYFIERVIVQMREMDRIQRSATKEKERTGDHSGTFAGEEAGEGTAQEQDMRAQFTERCTPYRFYRHFTSHNIDPTLAHLMSLWRQNEMIRIIETECLLERHDQTGRFNFRADLMLGYTRLLTARKQTYEADTSKMLGYTTQRQLNTSKPNPLINHHRPQFNPHSALSKQVFPAQSSPLLF